MATTQRQHTTSTTGAALPDATRLGAVHLTVTDVDRSVGWYQDVIGLQLHERDGSVAALGVGGEPLVVLHEDAQARPAGRHAGLYHYALLFPRREELARVARRIAETRTPIQGMSDHETHEAIYLPDPDGNGIELAADRPRERWPDLRYVQGPSPLDIQAVLATIEGEPLAARADAGLRMGHLHLHVADLEQATRFYGDGIGFEVMAQLPTAMFVAAGGYHHHLGFNVWKGEGVPPAPADAVGLRHWTIYLPGQGELDAARSRLAAIGADVEERDGGLLARDPSGTAVLLAAEPAGS